MILIDGKDLIVGRVATFVAKQALLGETVRIVNSEKMIITGPKKFLKNDVMRRRDQGTWSKGPFYFRQADRFVRRIVRGMLPYKTNRGKTAYGRVLCYVGMPEEFKTQKQITIEKANIRKVPNLQYMTVEQLCKHMGAK
jgi:large subunit ribosomal protein L13